MALLLKQSTQVVELIGPFLDKTDGVTEEAGLAGTGTEISKAGAAFGAGPVLGTHDSDGWYPITLTTTHTNTLGALKVKVHDATTHLPVFLHYMVVPANIFDSIVSGTDLLDISVVQLLGTAWLAPGTAGTPDVNVKLWNALTTVALPLIPATAGRTLVVDAAGLADANTVKLGPSGSGTAQTARDVGLSVLVGDKTGFALSAAGVQAIWDALTSALTTVGSIGKKLADWVVGTIDTYTGNTKQTGDAFARLGVPAGASVSADIAAVKVVDDAIKAKTDNLPASPASTTNITGGTITTVTNLTNAPTAGDLTTAMKASVNVEVVDGLNVDTYAEPGQGAPTATTSLAAKIGYLFKAWRNKKTKTSTTSKLFADDGTTVDQKTTDSDDGTTGTRGEVASGP